MRNDKPVYICERRASYSEEGEAWIYEEQRAWKCCETTGTIQKSQVWGYADQNITWFHGNFTGVKVNMMNMQGNVGMCL